MNESEYHQGIFYASIDKKIKAQFIFFQNGLKLAIASK